jgi:hypothetical protein
MNVSIKMTGTMPADVDYKSGIECTLHYKSNELLVLHRLDGPAIEYKPEYSHLNKWYINGELLPCSSQEEFERLVKLKLYW